MATSVTGLAAAHIQVLNETELRSRLSQEVQEIKGAITTQQQSFVSYSEDTQSEELTGALIANSAKCLNQLKSTFNVLNLTCEADPSRSEVVGKAILRQYYKTLKKSPQQDDNQKDFISICGRTNQLMETLPEFDALSSILPLVPTKNLPVNRGAYHMNAEPSTEAEYSRLCEAIQIKKRELNGEDDQARVPILEGELGVLDLNEENLFNKTNVNPFKVPELLTLPSLKCSLPMEAVTALAKTIASLDKIKIASEQISVEIPFVDTNNIWSTKIISLTPDLLKNPQVYEPLLELYSVARALVQATSRTARENTHCFSPAYSENCKRALTIGTGKNFPLLITTFEPKNLQPVVEGLLLTGLVENGTRSESKHLLADTSSSLHGMMAVIQYLFQKRQNETETAPIFKELNSISSLNGEPLNFLQGVFRNLKEMDAGNLQAVVTIAHDCNRMIDTWESITRVGALPAVFLSVLSALSKDTVVGPKLKKQLTRFDELRELLQKQPKHFQEAVDSIQSAFTDGMKGYYGNKLVVQRGRLALYEYLKIARDKRHLLARKTADEVLDSSILLYGITGGGKSFLAKSLADESGLHIYTISPESCLDKAKEKGLESADMLQTFISGAEIIVEEAAKESEEKPCIVLLDELEEMGQDRRDTNLSEIQGARTPYMLRLASRIRTKHVGIFLIGATNFFDRIDEAMYRDGRFDILIEVLAPSHEDRMEIIQGVLGELTKPPLFDDAQISELATITDGLIPISIKKAINMAEILKQSDDNEEPVTFQEVKDRLLRKVEDRTIKGKEDK